MTISFVMSISGGEEEEACSRFGVLGVVFENEVLVGCV